MVNYGNLILYGTILTTDCKKIIQYCLAAVSFCIHTLLLFFNGFLHICLTELWFIASQGVVDMFDGLDCVSSSKVL